MFSYLRAVRTLTTDDIYQLGLKEYLVGNVLDYVQLDLKNWRQYQVKGKEDFTVIVPLLHLLTTKLQWKEGGENLKKFTQCTCEYFRNIGTCKHIIAVCASLDRELKPLHNSSAENQVATPTLTHFINLESQNQVGEWMHEFEYFFELHDEDDPQNLSLGKLYETIRIAASGDYWGALSERLHRYITSNIDDYQFQKRFSKLVLFSRAWLVAGVGWWKLLLPFFSQLQPLLLLKIWSELWKEYEFFGASIPEAIPLIQSAAQELDSTQKLEIISLLQEQAAVLATQLSFAQFSMEEGFLREHLSQMDALQLVQLLPVMEEYKHDIEYHLVNQLKTFSDFLNVSNESTLVRYLKEWRNMAPDSAEFTRVLEYIKNQHKRRKKFIGQLRGL